MGDTGEGEGDDEYEDDQGSRGGSTAEALSDLVSTEPHGARGVHPIQQGQPSFPPSAAATAEEMTRTPTNLLDLKCTMSSNLPIFWHIY